MNIAQLVQLYQHTAHTHQYFDIGGKQAPKHECCLWTTLDIKREHWIEQSQMREDSPKRIISILYLERGVKLKSHHQNEFIHNECAFSLLSAPWNIDWTKNFDWNWRKSLIYLDKFSIYDERLSSLSVLLKSYKLFPVWEIIFTHNCG